MKLAFDGAGNLIGLILDSSSARMKVATDRATEVVIDEEDQPDVCRQIMENVDAVRYAGGAVTVNGTAVQVTAASGTKWLDRIDTIDTGITRLQAGNVTVAVLTPIVLGILKIVRVMIVTAFIKR